MRLRGIAVLALSTTACAAVVGLGDYEVTPEADDGGSPNETGAMSSSSSGVVANEAGGMDALADVVSDAQPKDDAGALDADAASVDAKADADAAPVDAGPDAYANRQGTACSDTQHICSGSPPCCHTNADNFTCLSGQTCQGPANGEIFECDDRSDCKSGQQCCVVLTTDKKAKASFCSASCPSEDKRACITNADCSSGNCLLPENQYPSNALPLLKICR